MIIVRERQIFKKKILRGHIEFRNPFKKLKSQTLVQFYVFIFSFWLESSEFKKHMKYLHQDACAKCQMLIHAMNDQFSQKNLVPLENCHALGLHIPKR